VTDFDLRPDDARSMRWPLAIGVAVLVGLAYFFFEQVDGHRRAEPTAAEAQAAARGLVAASAPAAPASKPAPAPVAWCEAKSFASDSSGKRMREALAEPLRDAEATARALLIASAAPRSQAFGHYATWVWAEARRRELEGRTLRCTERRDCAAEPRMVAGMAREELVRLAAPGRDPMVYALAFEACEAMGPQATERGSCQLITAEQWARVDPGNALPWVAVSAHAQLRDDAEGVREALYRVAAAKRADGYRGALSAALLPHAPSDVRDSALTAWVVTTAGLESARRTPPLSAIDLHCSAVAVRDANCRQVCEQIAGLLHDRSDALALRQFGLELGRRVGWPAERVAASEQRQDAMLQLVATHAPEFERLTCASASLLGAYLRRQAGHGEVGALDELLAESPLDMAELARRQRLDRAPREIASPEAVPERLAVSR
jgi:hypothetical protein